MSKTNQPGRVRLTAIAAAIAITAAHMRGFHTQDVAFGFRMGAGLPGTITRPIGQTKVEPCVQHASTPVLGYALACVVDTASNTVRQMAAGDTAVTRIYGITPRPYPTQQSSGGMTAAFGAGAPPAGGVIDVMREGGMLVNVVGTPTKDGPVFVWVAATSGNNVQGSFQAAASAGNTAAIANARFNGPPDANGVCEIIVMQT